MSFFATQPFLPRPLPPADLSQPEAIQKAVFKARLELAELNGYAHAIPNPLLLMSPWVVREAVASSEIENINTTILLALQNQLLPQNSRSGPDKEVLRYRDAMIWGYENMAQLPLSGRLIRGVHAQLLPESEGFRRTQNFIQNSLTREVIFTPPPPGEVPGLISDLEVFIHEDQSGLDPLVKAAMTHYQFEAIHPFTDGNGRTGRILIVLQLIHEQILRYPILYISGYIIRHKQMYYRLLREVSQNHTWTEFILFFLEAFYQQSKQTKDVLFAVMEYREQFRDKFRQELPALFSVDLTDELFSHPVITAPKLAEHLGIHRSTALRYLHALAAAGFLQARQEGKRQFYLHLKLLDILSQ